jgi:hypothetical protein
VVAVEYLTRALLVVALAVAGVSVLIQVAVAQELLGKVLQEVAVAVAVLHILLVVAAARAQ